MDKSKVGLAAAAGMQMLQMSNEVADMGDEKAAVSALSVIDKRIWLAQCSTIVQQSLASMVTPAASALCPEPIVRSSDWFENICFQQQEELFVRHFRVGKGSFDDVRAVWLCFD